MAHESDKHSQEGSDNRSASPEPSPSNTSTSTPQLSSQTPAQTAATERQKRFAALQARQRNAREQNRRATQAEEKRARTNPALNATLARKEADAIARLDKAESGAGAYERKRAWDWTVDESAEWDRRLEKKARARDDVAFSDFSQTARKVYKRQAGGLGEGDVQGYEAAKAAAVLKAAEAGRLELVEVDGEVVAVDHEGTFMSGGGTEGGKEYKPSKEKIDALVDDLNKAEEQRRKQRRQRNGQDDGGDVTYINEKNRVYNQKLARFYNKYTADIRENFERGTAM